jgi:hypothetical protein
MAAHKQLIGHAEAEADAYIGPSRELTIVTETGALRSHDGTTPGGRKIPTEDQIAGFSVLRFNAIASIGVPGVIPDTAQNKLTRITAGGNYDLPAVADILNVGGPVVFKAMVPAVILNCQGADVIESGAANVTTINMVEGEIVTLAKSAAGVYVLLDRFTP